MSQRAIRLIATAVLILGFLHPSGAGDAPELSASYTVSEAHEGADTVSMTFSFALRGGGGKAITVDKIILGDPSKADLAYATFEGGTLSADRELKRSSGASVPRSEFKRWKEAAPALFVYTRNDRGDTVRTRVDPYLANRGR